MVETSTPSESYVARSAGLHGRARTFADLLERFRRNAETFDAHAID